MPCRKLILIFALLIFARVARGQSAEIQVYPAGAIAVVGWEFSLTPHLESRLHLGYNVTRRRDFGEHDDERGSGPGVGADVSWFFDEGHPRLWIGARFDAWLLDIKWRNDRLSLSGETQITVVQPSVRSGFRSGAFDFTLGLGVEINAGRKGEKVGQGAILLAGLRLNLR